MAENGPTLLHRYGWTRHYLVLPKQQLLGYFDSVTWATAPRCGGPSVNDHMCFPSSRSSSAHASCIGSVSASSQTRVSAH